MSRVSIITPSFNRADIVHETAESIFRQTHTDWEWMIVDDGSTDNSWELLESYAAKDNRVRIFKRDREPKGACVCRNIAVERSTGEYLIFLDTDDLMASFCLEQRVKAMQEQPQNDLIIFQMLLFKKKPDDMKILWNIENGEDDLARILYGDPICQGTGTLWKKESFIRVGKWKEDLLLWQDIELHIRSLLSHVVFSKRLDLPPDVFLRESDVSLSRTGFHSIGKLQSRIRVLEDTIEEMNDQHLLRKYIDPLRRMFRTIFQNAINSGYKTEIDHLLGLAKNFNLFPGSQMKLLRRIAFTRRYKINRIPVLNKIFNPQLPQDDSYKALMGTVTYNKEIRI